MRGSARDRRAYLRERRDRAAAARVGHDLAYWWMFGWPAVKYLGPPALILGGVWWLWVNVDHGTLAYGAGWLAALCVVIFLVTLVWPGKAYEDRRLRDVARRVTLILAVALAFVALAVR